MHIEPIYDRVIIKKTEHDTKTKGGLYIPEQAKDRPFTGVVVASGPGKHSANGAFIPNQLKSGDRVVFGKYAGSEIEIDNQKLLLLKEEDIFGKLVEDAPVQEVEELPASAPEGNFVKVLPTHAVYADGRTVELK